VTQHPGKGAEAAGQGGRFGVIGVLPNGGEVYLLSRNLSFASLNWFEAVLDKNKLQNQLEMKNRLCK